MQTPDVVVLVPGFLGLSRFGGFYYFADRLIAVLWGLLEEPLGYGVPVILVTTLPTDSLRKRKRVCSRSWRASARSDGHEWKDDGKLSPRRDSA